MHVHVTADYHDSLGFKNKEEQMKYIVILICIFATGFYFYGNEDKNKIVPITDLSVAITHANEQNKFMFILFGRERCSNCRSLRNYIEEKEIDLPAESFVYADINCDDKLSQNTFYENFSVEGRSLPFVIVADSYGRQFAARCGYGSPQEFTKLIDDAVTHIERGY